MFASHFSGHSCNRTFLFMILKETKLVNKIEGKGLRGAQFYVSILQ